MTDTAMPAPECPSRPQEGPSGAPWELPETEELGRCLAALLKGLPEELRAGPIAPVRGAEATEASVRGLDLGRPIGARAAAFEMAGLMAEGDLRSAGARCFGYFNPTAAWPAVLADLVVSARNPQLAVTTHAPASMAMERRVLAWMAERIGWDAGATGHFTSGGSEANGAGLLIALVRAEPRFAEEGARAFRGAPRIYASKDAHLAWIKLARAAGLGTDAVRLVSTDGRGRLDPAALAGAMAEDRARGDVAVMVAATVGTTNAGEIDPVLECRALCEEHGAHLHVDAAWAGALVVSDDHRPLVSCLELADTVTIDAHKWLSVPMGTGMAFARKREWVHRAYAVRTGYMPAGDGEDAYITTGQWSRRFLGARLWMMLRATGADGYREMFARHFELADALRTALAERGWRVRDGSALPVVLFEDALYGLPARALADALEKDGATWLGCVEYEGREALRACMTSFLTGPDDIALLLERLDAVREALANA